MSKELDQYRNTAEIMPDDQPSAVFYNKPVVGALLTLLIGIAILLVPYLLIRILGVPLIIGGIYVLFIYRSCRVLSFHENGIVVYKDMDDSKAIYLSYAEIKQWSCKRSNYGSQAVVLMKKNKDYVYVELDSLHSVRKALNTYLPNKEFIQKEGNK